MKIDVFLMNMNFIYRVLLLCFVAACSNKTAEKSASTNSYTAKIINETIQSILDSADLRGTIVIFNSQENTYTSNDFQWADSRFLPASTFKIPNTIIALETGLLRDENTVLKWNGEKHWMEAWNKDLKLKEAFHASCVPCYQEIAQKIGVGRMKRYLNSFGYPEMYVDSSNIDMFWLNGKGRITPMEQIAFLKTFNEGGLPIKAETYTKAKTIFIREENEHYTLSAKTGWSSGENIENGWFVGFVETKGNVYYFATNIEPKGNRQQNDYYRARIEVTLSALKALSIIR
jgi:beta-lactamase class D